jgi:hypothetical protein
MTGVTSVRSIDPSAYYLVLAWLLVAITVIGLTELTNTGPDCSSYQAYWESVDAENIVYEYPNGSVAYSYETRPEMINMTVRNNYYYDCQNIKEVDLPG